MSTNRTNLYLRLGQEEQTEKKSEKKMAISKPIRANAKKFVSPSILEAMEEAERENEKVYQAIMDDNIREALASINARIKADELKATDFKEVESQPISSKEVKTSYTKPESRASSIPINYTHARTKSLGKNY